MQPKAGTNREISQPIADASPDQNARLTATIQTAHESRPSPSPNNIFTYRRLRRMIGILGVALPVVLVLLSLFPYFETDIQPSISHYYFTHLREIFTGTLCGVGLFLICYKGQYNRVLWKNDNFLTNFAGLMAFGVAFIPTSLANDRNDCAEKIFSLIPACDPWLGWLHYAFTGLLFVSFSVLAIVVFTKGQRVDPRTEKSWMNENNIYQACGYSILFFVAMVPVSSKLDLFDYSTLLFEALSLFAFGIAWLIKGRIMGDKGKIGEKIYRECNAKKEGKSEKQGASNG